MADGRLSVDLSGEKWDIWVSSSESSHSENGGRDDQGDNRFRTSPTATLYLGEAVSWRSVLNDARMLRARIEEWLRIQENLRSFFPAAVYHRDVVDVSRQGAGRTNR